MKAYSIHSVFLLLVFELFLFTKEFFKKKKKKIIILLHRDNIVNTLVFTLPEFFGI